MDLQRGGNIGLAVSNYAVNRLQRTTIHGSSVLDSSVLGSGATGDALHSIRRAEETLDARFLATRLPGCCWKYWRQVVTHGLSLLARMPTKRGSSTSTI